jgi:hypothetical protein
VFVALVRGRKTYGAVWRFCFLGISDILEELNELTQEQTRLKVTEKSSCWRQIRRGAACRGKKGGWQVFGWINTSSC